MRHRQSLRRKWSSLVLVGLALAACLGLAVSQAVVGAPQEESRGRIVLTFSAEPIFTPQPTPARSEAWTAVGCVSAPTFALLSLILAAALIVHRRQSQETIDNLQAQLDEATGQTDDVDPDRDLTDNSL